MDDDVHYCTLYNITDWEEEAPERSEETRQIDRRLILTLSHVVHLFTGKEKGLIFPPGFPPTDADADLMRRYPLRVDQADETGR